MTESIPPDQLTAELRDRGVPVADAIPTNQLTIFSTDESWLAGGELTAATMMDRIAGYLDEADRQGYTGLRLSADMCWVNRPIAAADQLPVFESEVGKFFGEGRLTAVCQYDRDIFDAVTLAFAAATHARMVAAAVYYEDPVLRICRQHVPPGVRIAGELDFRHIDELALAFNEALQLDRDIQVNLAKLRFVDAAAAATIAHAALSLDSGRVMSILCAGPVLRMLRLAGVTDIPAVRVVSTHGER